MHYMITRGRRSVAQLAARLRGWGFKPVIYHMGAFGHGCVSQLCARLLSNSLSNSA